MKVAVLFDNFGPYHHARLTAAAGTCELLAVEFGCRSGEYAWVAQSSETLRHEVINTDGPGAVMPARQFGARLEGILSDFGPNVVVVPGWSNRGGFMAMAWALRHGVPIVLMSESTAWDENRVCWKEWIKRRIVGLSSAALVGGQPHAEYMCQLGMKEKQVFLGYDAVDNDYFAAEAAKWRRLASADMEATLNEISAVNLPPYFLASNRFIEKKNLFRVLGAYARYLQSEWVAGKNGQCEDAQQAADKSQQRVLPWDLCMLGDGELREKLLAHCETLGLHVATGAPWEAATSNCQPPTVYFPGFRQIEELPQFYAHAGAFVHASTTEQWGLVINEAMASSLPVIVSNRVGCAKDVVQDGINGFAFDPYDVEQLAQLMIKVANSSFPLAEFGDASRRIISGWGPDRFASGLKAACAKALDIGSIRSGVLDRLLLEILLRKQ